MKSSRRSSGKNQVCIFFLVNYSREKLSLLITYLLYLIEPQFGKARSESVKGSSRASSSSRSSISRPEQTSDIANLFETSPPASRPVTPSVEASAVSRPTTPTLPSFLQSANVINVTINYGGDGSKGTGSD